MLLPVAFRAGDTGSIRSVGAFVVGGTDFVNGIDQRSHVVRVDMGVR